MLGKNKKAATSQEVTASVLPLEKLLQDSAEKFEKGTNNVIHYCDSLLAYSAVAASQVKVVA